MPSFTFTTKPPEAWSATCLAECSLFGSSDWQALLEAAFDCHTLYGWNGGGGAAITIFKAGPFRIGYLGFPIGSLAGNDPPVQGLLSDLASSDVRRLPACVRIPVSAFQSRGPLELSFAANPETAITQLQDWELCFVSKKLRRDVRKAERSGLRVSKLRSATRANELHDIYKSTVEQHGGSVRYTSSYFEELVKLASHNPAVRIYIASQDSDIAGFGAILHHGNSAYYLHGGTAAGYRKQNPSDLILSRAINDSKTDGAKIFNLMASPADQPTLVRYKEKWGAETRQLKTYTFPISVMYPLFAAAERIYQSFA